MENQIKKKVIEEWYPIELVGEEGRLEKTSPSGRIQTIHQWHARRPTSAIRAVLLSCLLSFTENYQENEILKELIIQYSKRFIPENYKCPIIASDEFDYLNATLQTILKKSLKKELEGKKVRALDPFSGGGSIPFELSMLGIESYATDLNPVAVLINKATTDYLIRYKSKLVPDLIGLIKKYANIILNDLKMEIGFLFDNPDANKNEILFYIWTREIPCQNKRCGLFIPMFKSLVLDLQNKIALVPKSYENNQIIFEIGWQKKLKDLEGYYKRGALTCPRCGVTIPKERIHKISQEMETLERLIAIYELTSDKQRLYRIASKRDLELFQKVNNVSLKFRPDLDLPERILMWRIQAYGIKKMSQMFNSRQYLVASTLSSKIKSLYNRIEKEEGEDLAKVIITFLQFGLDKLVDFNSKFCMVSHGTRIRNTWTRPGLFMTGMYTESNPFYKDLSGGWLKYFDDLEKVLKNIQDHPSFSPIPSTIKQMNACVLEFEDNFFDLIITDPPYYDSIPYAADADFFYVWDRASLKEVFPDLFLANSSPKAEELVADPNMHGGSKGAKEFYEDGLTKAFKEMYRVLKQNGLIVVIFANKKMDAWETLLQSFIKSKFVITATWPVPMESKGKLAALTTAQLTSVVLVVARKISKELDIYFDKKFQNSIRTYIEHRMESFWKEGIRGADFFLCAIGPALTYYSKYENILDPSTDKQIDVATYLSFIQNIMISFAVKQIATSMTSGELDSVTQFYLVWRWGYGLNLLPFDEVKKLYQALLIEFGDLDGNYIERQKKKADYACKTPNERFLEMTDEKIKKFQVNNMIDYLHLACYLWEKDKRELLEEKISDALLKFSDSFWTIAQALYDILPECQEATQLQGLLQRYKKFKPSERPKRIEKEKRQKDLLSYIKNGDSEQAEEDEQEEDDSKEESDEK